MSFARRTASCLLAVSLSACGSGGGGGGDGDGGPPPPPPPAVTFTVAASVSPGLPDFYMPPYVLGDVALSPLGDDDAVLDLLYASTGLYTSGVETAELSMPGLGDGSFFSNYGGGGYGPGGPALVDGGDLIGPGLGGGVFALERSTSVAVVTTGQHFEGLSRSAVGGFRSVAGAHLTALAVGDWDGDGTDDVAFADGPGSSVHTLISNGATAPDAAVTVSLPPGSAPNSIVAIDADGNAFLDLACGDDTGGVHVLVRGSTGDHTVVGNPGDLGASSRRIEAMGSGDFDQDGTDDLAGVLRDGTVRSLFTMHGDGDGTFDDPETTDLPVDIRFSAAVRLRTADFNLDGIPDVAFVVPDASRLAVFLGDGAGGFAECVDADLSGAGNWDSLAVGDVDGDGDVDLMVVDAAAFSIRVLLNDAL